MYNVFDKNLTGNSYVQFFGDDNKPMVNTLQGPSEDAEPDADEDKKCQIK